MADGATSTFARPALAASAIVLAAANVLVAVALLTPQAISSGDGHTPPPEKARPQSDVGLVALAERPLFDPTRRSAAPVAQATESSRLPILKGIGLAPGGRKSAVLAGAEGPVVVREGATVAGVTVVAINATSIEVDTAKGRRTLTLDRARR
ncbi:MAG: hypothetical protein AAGJ87_07415 [Pseudomonadota bacterium]